MGRKVSRKKLLLIVFIIVLSSFIFTNNYMMVRAQSEPVLTMCTISQEYKEWEKLSDEEKAKTLKPFMCDTEADKSLKYVSDSQRERMFSIFSLGSSYPSVYNPTVKEHEANKFLSIIKNQGTSSNCWAFSTTSHLEIFAKKKLNLNQIYSPEHMTYTNVRDLVQGTNEKGYNRTIDSGGDFEMTSNYLANAYGPVLELDSNDRALLANNKDLTFVNSKISQFDVNNIIVNHNSSYKNGCEGIRNQLKDYIMEHGSVLVSTHMDTSAAYYNSNTGAYYYNGEEAPNHAVLIVGWDDTYKTSNFSTNPGSSGAWIVQNSYGSNWGNGGYYYISYEDVNTCYAQMVVSDVDKEFEDNSYIYDKLGPSGYMGYQTKENNVVTKKYNYAYAMNVFTKEKEKAELLKEVRFASAGVGKYKIYYKAGNANGNSVYDMTEVGSGNLTNRGYVTHKLDVPVSMGRNVTDFSIVVYYYDMDTVVPIPISTSESSKFSYITLDKGKSFISLDGSSWGDLNSSSSVVQIVSIKAYTEDIDYSLSLGNVSLKKQNESLVANLDFYIESNVDVNYKYVLTNDYGLEIEPSKVSYNNYALNSNNNVTLTFNNNNFYNGNYLLNVYLEYDGKESLVGTKSFMIFEEVTSSVYKINRNELIIYVPSGTKIDDLENNLNKVSGVVYHQGKFYEDGLVVSGMVIDGYLLVIKGDVTGDGLVTPLDYISVKNHIMETSMLTDTAFMYAADYNLDSSISPLDYVEIKNYIMNGA